jgi:hypothetical protein
MNHPGPFRGQSYFYDVDSSSLTTAGRHEVLRYLYEGWSLEAIAMYTRVPLEALENFELEHLWWLAYQIATGEHVF